MSWWVVVEVITEAKDGSTNSLLWEKESNTTFWAATPQQRGMAGGNGAMNERWGAPDDGKEGEMGR
jgi:hypothetical protein